MDTQHRMKWLDDVSVALADARATLACFGVNDARLMARIDAALAEAQALKAAPVRP